MVFSEDIIRCFSKYTYQRTDGKITVMLHKEISSCFSLIRALCFCLPRAGLSVRARKQLFYKIRIGLLSVSQILIVDQYDLSNK